MLDRAEAFNELPGPFRGGYEHSSEWCRDTSLQGCASTTCACMIAAMSVAVTLVAAAPASSARLLADVADLHGRKRKDRAPVVDRLAAALGAELAERLVAELSREALGRLDAGLTREFVDRLAALSRESA